MTIAAAYVTAEAVVLGADSTTTYANTGGNQYYNHSQKIFEIGENSTLAAVTWGLGGLNVSSYRTLIALFSDSFKHQKPKNVTDAASKWSKQFWNAYTTSPLLASTFDRARNLNAKKPFDPSSVPVTADMRTDAEEQEVSKIRQDYAVGFCIGGYVLPDRTPKALSVIFDPSMATAPTPLELPLGASFWGALNVVLRTLNGFDPNLQDRIIQSGKWSGTPLELTAILDTCRLGIPILPVRDALDFVNISLLSTIKTFKFASPTPICGGSVELGLITSDRTFRWVKHKPWTSAIGEEANA